MFSILQFICDLFIVLTLLQVAFQVWLAWGGVDYWDFVRVRDKFQYIESFCRDVIKVFQKILLMQFWSGFWNITFQDLVYCSAFTVEAWTFVPLSKKHVLHLQKMLCYALWYCRVHFLIACGITINFCPVNVTAPCSLLWHIISSVLLGSSKIVDSCKVAN
jgi:hypothetical protein